MRKRLGLTLLGCCLFATAACNMINPPEKKSAAALDDFVYALRWQQYNAAASFMKPELREPFLSVFNNKDLTVVDVRLAEALVAAEGRRTEAIIEVDYYLLPSLVVQTFRFEQTWIYFDQEGQGHYQIVTALPDFP